MHLVRVGPSGPLLAAFSPISTNRRTPLTGTEGPLPRAPIVQPAPWPALRHARRELSQPLQRRPSPSRRARASHDRKEETGLLAKRM